MRGKEALPQSVFGNLGDPIEPVLALYGNVPIAPSTIHTIRAGESSGLVVGNRKASELLHQEGSARRKHTFYADNFLGEALWMRAGFVISEEDSPIIRYNSEGFADEMIKKLAMTQGTYNNCLRAMRSDMRYSLAKQPFPFIEGHFRSVARNFLRSLQRNGKGKDMQKEWDGITIESFYASLDTFGPRTKSVWTIHELEVLEHFYDTYGERFTPFDDLLLSSYQAGKKDTSVQSEFAETLGTHIGKEVLWVHRNVLHAGYPQPKKDKLSKNGHEPFPTA